MVASCSVVETFINMLLLLLNVVLFTLTVEDEDTDCTSKPSTDLKVVLFGLKVVKVLFSFQMEILKSSQGLKGITVNIHTVLCV